MRVRDVVGVLGSLLLVGMTVASADSIQKWRTPEGALYFGDRPPAGSTLVETIADSPTRVSSEETVTSADLARAAEEGRDIIRRREAVRSEERKIDADRQAWLDELEASQPTYETPWYVGGGLCLPGDPCFVEPDPPRRHRRHDDDGLRPIGRGQWRDERRARWRNPVSPPLRPLPQPAPQREAMGGGLLSPLR